MNPIVLLVCGGAACAAAVTAGLVIVPDGPEAALLLAAAGTAFHAAMIALDIRSAVFGLAAVMRDERSVLYRRLARRAGLAVGGACMWGLVYALAWVALPVLLAGTWPDARMSGMFLTVFGAIHMCGWLSNRRMAGDRKRAA